MLCGDRCEISLDVISKLHKKRNSNSQLQDAEKMNTPVYTLQPAGTLEDVTSVDILCGKSKKCFNHSGNRRFRFLVSFNLDRYKEAKSRKEKSSVVASVLCQIRDSGGKFLILNVDDKVVLATEKMAKEKISHALRDKTPFPGMKVAREQLRRRLGNHASRCEHYHYLVANERILQVDLPSDQHAADDKVERILTEEIELLSSNSPHNDDVAVTIASTAQLQSVSSSTEDLRQPTPPILQDEESSWKIANVVNARSSRVSSSCGKQESLESQQSWGEHFTRREMVNEASMNTRKKSETPFGTFLLMSDDEAGQNLLEEEEDVISDWWNLSEDLPPNFTEDDCENLVAMLDYASSL